jgi:hypothetical protein
MVVQAVPLRPARAWFQTKGTAIKVVEYPGVYHLFDGTEPLHFVPEAVTAPNCDLEYDTDTPAMQRTDTGALLTGARAYFRSCTSRGIHIGGDAQARGAAEREIAAFLKAAL